LGSDTYSGCTDLVVVFAWLVMLSQEGRSKGYRSKDHPGLGREEEKDISKDHEEQGGGAAGTLRSFTDPWS
jgi:hypothetical protein